jgi:hypothetical protein
LDIFNLHKKRVIKKNEKENHIKSSRSFLGIRF